MHLEGEWGLEDFSIDADEGVKAQRSGLRAEHFEREVGAAAHRIAQDVATGRMKLKERIGAFVKGMQVGEGLQEGL